MLCNEKYKGDFHLQKYYTPENKRNHTRKNNGEVQSYYISENHEPIVSPEVWKKVQEVREQRKRDRNIGQDSTVSAEIEDGGVLPSVNRPRRTVIKL